MSRLYFHTESEGTVEVMGWEHAWLGSVPMDIARGFVPTMTEILEPALPPDSPLRHWLNSPALRNWIGVYLRTPTIYLAPDGEKLDSWTLALNTALAVGSDPVALATRLAAQCEIHCYVEGIHRAWLAMLIEQGRACGLFRARAGWEDVATLLRSRTDAPVVCSYSVEDGFPNPTVAGFEIPTPEGLTDEEHNDWLDSDALSDAWYELPEAEQWARAMAGLRGNPERLLELAPHHLRGPFGHSRTFLDVFATSPADRVRR